MLLNNFAFKYNLVEVVIFKLVDLDTMFFFQLINETQRLLLAALLREGNCVELFDVFDIEDREALFEFVWEFLDMFTVAERKHDSRDVMILASCQLFPDTSDCDNFAEGGDLTSHCQVGSHRLAGCTGDKGSEERRAS